VLNGLSVGAGMLLLCGLIAAVAGVPAAITASSGAASTSVADTICTRQHKRFQMIPAVCGSMLVTGLVGLTHTQPWLLALCSLLVIFVSICWMAWGKRGGPVAFVSVLALVFQTAAWLHGDAGSEPMALGPHLMWTGMGAIGMALWAWLTAWLLARRYRDLALADVLDALATLTYKQAHWARQAARPAPDAPADPAALLALIRAQATLPDTLQAARDLIYVQAARGQQDARLRATTDSLIQAIRLRDVLMGCQLDLDRGPQGPESQSALLQLADDMRGMARRLHQSARAWRGLPSPEGSWPAAGHLNAATSAPGINAEPPRTHTPDQALHASLQRRGQHLAWLVDAVEAQAPAADSLPRGAMPTLIPSPLPPVNVAAQAPVLLGMTSAPGWPLAPLKAQAHWGSPVLRYAARTTLAAACAIALGHLMPWSSHPYWVLMTVAVVMRGSLEQTLMRRNARIQGTLLGCLLATSLVALWPSPWAMLLCTGLALSLAHGFVNIDYRITAASGAVMALLQGPLFLHTSSHIWLDAGERLADTLIGVAVAWAFSHVWPAWERQTLPRLVGRLLQSLARDAHHALTAWEAPPAGSSLAGASGIDGAPGSPDSLVTHSSARSVHHSLQHGGPTHTPATRQHLDRHLARRDTQETLALLTQALQRMDKEPDSARIIAPEVERLLIHCHELSSLIAGIRGLLSLKGDQIVPEVAQPALTQTHRAIVQAFRDTRPDVHGDGGADANLTRPGPYAWASPADSVDTDLSLPKGEGELDPSADTTTTTAWLLRRLTQARHVAQEVADAARPLRTPS
jgi:uncharacterized membrane protein YccC